ncbi:MAG: hypothetical protein JNM21_00300 [Taibaiella sp.]|nr:hypothetical protein [Taibaiella sp.]
MEVNGKNITGIIKYLYEKRLNQAASEEVLQSWSNLTDPEARMHLNQLFQTWGYTQEQVDAELQQYFSDSATPDLNSTIAPLTGNTPPPQQQAAPYTTQQQSPPRQPLPQKKARSSGWLWIILLPLLAAGAYVIYKFQQFKNLHYLYVTTDNVSIRDHEGNNIGRMDIFASGNSVSFLRTTDINTYPIKVGNNIYQCRRVIFDSTAFTDFLFNKPEAFGYINENYVIDDKDNFIVYRNVFQVINGVKNENASLTSPFRKTIVGSIRQNPAMKDLYIMNACNNGDKTYSALITIKNKEDIHQVVALLSDGKYYIFSGNPTKQEYEAPQPFQYKVPGIEQLNPYQNDNLLFRYVNKTYFIFDCNGTARDYYTVLDNKGLIDYAKYSFEP